MYLQEVVVSDLVQAKKDSVHALLKADSDALTSIRTAMEWTPDKNSEDLEEALAQAPLVVASFKEQEKYWKKLKFSTQEPPAKS